MATVKVTRVEAAGPGAKAGLQVDDFILSVAGRPVSRVSEVAYLTQLIGVDGPIELQVQRAVRGALDGPFVLGPPMR